MLDTIRTFWHAHLSPKTRAGKRNGRSKEANVPDLRTLDELYKTWMTCEADEQAALVMLGFRDDVEVRAAYEIAVERVEAARAAYDAALRPAAPVAA
jgi:hypothetical protein